MSLHNTRLENSLHKTEMKIVQKVSTETQRRLNSVQQIREQISLLQPHPQIIRRTSSTTPVPATPTSRVRPHRKLHNRYRLKSLSSHDDNNASIQHETQGVFTSAPATPESQQNLIVQNFSDDQFSNQQDQALNLHQPSNQHDQYPLPDEFSFNDPSLDAANEGFSNQHSPDQPSNQHSHQLNQHTSDHYSADQQSLNQHNSDQQSLNQHNSDQLSLNQRDADRNSPDPIQTDTVQNSRTHSSS